MMKLGATFSTSGSSYLNVALTTVHHLYNVERLQAVKTIFMIIQAH